MINYSQATYLFKENNPHTNHVQMNPVQYVYHVTNIKVDDQIM